MQLSSLHVGGGGRGEEGALVDMTNDGNVQQKRFPFLACKFLGGI